MDLDSVQEPLACINRLQYHSQDMDAKEQAVSVRSGVEDHIVSLEPLKYKFLCTETRLYRRLLRVAHFWPHDSTAHINNLTLLFA